MTDKNIEYCKCCKLPKGLIICKTCNQEKKYDDFHAGKKICKDCRSEYNKKKYLNKKVQVENIHKQDVSLNENIHKQDVLLNEKV